MRILLDLNAVVSRRRSQAPFSSKYQTTAERHDRLEISSQSYYLNFHFELGFNEKKM